MAGILRLDDELAVKGQGTYLQRVSEGIPAESITGPNAGRSTTELQSALDWLAEMTKETPPHFGSYR